MKNIRRKNVNEAIRVLWLNKKDRFKKKAKTEKVDKLQDISSQCKTMHHYKRNERRCPRGFSKHRILSEIKSHVCQKNWSKVKNLFLLLLHSSTDIEPLIWRYSFILSLYSNIDNLSNVFQFFKTCIGSLDSDRNLILKNMLLLQHRK